MKNYLPLILIAIICSFVKKENQAENKANEFMNYCNANKIKARVQFEKKQNDSTYIVTLKNY
jgi:hypothetical protein